MESSPVDRSWRSFGIFISANHGFSRKFAWLNDRFGVSWQINLD